MRPATGMRTSLATVASAWSIAVEGDRVAAELEALERGEDGLGGRLGGELEDDAVGPDGRRADLEQELGGHRDPGGVAAGEALEADVAERVEQQGGGRLGAVVAPASTTSS